MMMTADQIGIQDVTEQVAQCCADCKAENMNPPAPHPSVPMDSMHMGE